MARIFLTGENEDLTIGGTNTIIGSASAGDEINVVAGSNLTLQGNFDGDTIALAQAADGFTAVRVGGNVRLSNGTTTILVPLTEEGTTISFDGEARTLMVNEAGEIMLGGQEITTEETDLDPVDEGGPLAAAVAELAAAQEALDDFYEEQPDTLDLDSDGDVDEDDIQANLDAANQNLVDDIDDDGTDAQVQNRLEDAQEAVDAIVGLDSAIEDLNSAEADFEAALETEEETAEELGTEMAVFETRNSADVDGVTLSLAAAAGLETVPEGDAVVVGDLDGDGTGDDLIVVGDNGQLEAASTAVAALPGFADLLADAQAAYNAAFAVEEAREDFEAAITEVVDLEGVNVDDPAFDAGDYYVVGAATPADGRVSYTLDFATDADLTTELTNAQAQADQREELNQAVQDAQDLVDQLETLQDTIDDEQNDFDGLGYEVPVEVDGTESATDGNDIYLVGDTGGTINDFGEEGNDLLYVGEGYTLTPLDSGVNLNVDGSAGTAGSASTLEIFVQESGDDTILWIEGSAFAGSDTTGTFDGIQIVLDGVEPENVSLDANGFISIEETATVA